MPLSAGFYRTISYQNASSKPEQRTNDILKYHPAFASRHTALHARCHAFFLNQLKYKRQKYNYCADLGKNGH